MDTAESDILSNSVIIWDDGIDASTETKERINTLLFQANQRMKSMYNWRDDLNIRIIDVNDGYLMDLQPGEIHVRFSQLISELDRGGDEEENVDYVASQLVHEYVHDETNYQDHTVTGEVASHAGQFLSYFGLNNQHIADRAIEGMQSIITTESGVRSDREMYIRARYAALLLIAEYIPKIKEKYALDKELHSDEVAREVVGILKEMDIDYRRQILSKIIALSKEEIIRMLRIYNVIPLSEVQPKRSLRMPIPYK